MRTSALFVAVLVLTLATVTFCTQPICFPDTFQLTSMDYDSTNHAVYVTRTYFDRTIGMTRSDVTEEPSKETFTIFEDFNAKTLYMVTGNTCRSTPITEPMPPRCLSQNATLDGTAVIGSATKVNIYTFEDAANTVTAVLEAQTDVPIQVLARSKDPQRPMTFLENIYDFDTKVDPSVFTIPSICKATTTTTTKF